MDTNPIPIPTTPSAPPASTPSGRDSAVLSSDFEVFLNMLTAQARYQDPLEPIDSSEYAAQLAQFSMVEQQVATNGLIERLVSAVTTSDVGNLTQWLGMDALTDLPAQFDGNPVHIVPTQPAAAEEMYLVVRDASGTIVDTQQMPLTSETVVWNGHRADGSALPYGQYSFEIEARAGGETLSIEPARSYARISEARLENGEMLLVLQGGHLLRTADILGLRDPEA